MATTPFIDLTGAQDYFDERLNSEAWDEATDVDRLKALKTATRLINNLRFVGTKQLGIDNEFPRMGQVDVPTPIKYATCELALQLLDDVDANLEIENINTVSDGFGPIRANFNRDFVLPHIRAGIPSSEAWALLLPYLADPLTLRLVRR